MSVSNTKLWNYAVVQCDPRCIGFNIYAQNRHEIGSSQEAGTAWYTAVEFMINDHVIQICVFMSHLTFGKACKLLSNVTATREGSGHFQPGPIPTNAGARCSTATGPEENCSSDGASGSAPVR